MKKTLMLFAILLTWGTSFLYAGVGDILEIDTTLTFDLNYFFLHLYKDGGGAYPEYVESMNLDSISLPYKNVKEDRLIHVIELFSPHANDSLNWHIEYDDVENDPYFPTVWMPWPIDDSYNLEDFTYQTKDTLALDGVELRPFEDFFFPIEQNVKKKSKGVEREWYPIHQVECGVGLYENPRNEHLKEKCLFVRVDPFKYDVVNHRTYVCTEIHLNIRLSSNKIDDAIHAPQSSIINHNSYNYQYYDLSGRRLATPPTRRGVYVNGGRKVMIK